VEKDKAVSSVLFELRCIGESLQAFGNSQTDGSPHPWFSWLGEQVERVADELDEGMLPPPRREKGSAQ
jgi:hypothetical protein